MKSKFLKITFILALIAGTFYYCTHMHSAFQIITGETMNTYYRIAIRSGQEDTMLNNEVKDALQQINSEMSVFESLSDLSQFNRNTDTGWIDVPEDLAVVLKEAYRVYQQTNGYFDPSVGHLVDMWGFGSNKIHRLPSAEEIKEAQKSVGLNKISFSRDFRKAQKHNLDVYLNLSSIAKGYAVDKLASLLDGKGYTDYIVEIGGEVKAKGSRAKKVKGWNLGIARPEEGKVGNYEYIIRLKDMSVATSGDYRNNFYIDNKRYSHTINPKTGYPSEHNLSSVTVFDKECMRADALATGILAMGEAKGIEFANNNRIPVIMFVRNENEDSFQTVISNEAKKLLKSDLINEVIETPQSATKKEVTK